MPGTALRWGGADAARSRLGLRARRAPPASARPAPVSRGRASATTRSSISDQPAEDGEHQGGQHPQNRPRGGSRPRAPRVWLRSPRFFTPYRPTRTRQDLPCTSAGEPRTPSWRSTLTFTTTGEGAWPPPNPPWDDGDRTEPVKSAYGVPLGSAPPPPDRTRPIPGFGAYRVGGRSGQVHTRWRLSAGRRSKNGPCLATRNAQTQ